jgi:hypothetical protein
MFSGATARIALAVLVFLLQVLGCNQMPGYFTRALDKGMRTDAFAPVFSHFPINHVTSVGFVFFFLANATASTLIIKLLYRNKLLTRAAVILTGLAFFAYIGTNAIGRAGDFPGVRKVSLEIATYATSPLLTILLVSALMVTKRKAAKVDSF